MASTQNGPGAEPSERSSLLANGSGEGAVETNNNNSHILSQFKDGATTWMYWPTKVSHLAMSTITRDYVNVLLVFVPLGIIAGVLDWDAGAVFALNFLAIIPLASLLGFATEELAATMGQALGGLMNATFGNAVELIVSIIAIKDGQVRVVQASMLGSILSNILLVLGCCFFIGGLRYREQSFNTTVASTMSSLLTIASASLIIPAALSATLGGDRSEASSQVLFLSHYTSIILLAVYVMYLYFQLKTHADLFEESQEGPSTTDIEQLQGGTEAEEEEDGEEHLLSPMAATVVLVIVTLLVAVCADYLVGSIDSIVQKTGMSKTFIGLVLIPIVGNAAEHVTAVMVAWKNKMDLAIGVAVGSSLQIALFVTPFLVILGWIVNVPMTLDFHTFETAAFFISGLVVTFLIQDGKSNYLEGGLCLGM